MKRGKRAVKSHPALMEFAEMFVLDVTVSGGRSKMYEVRAQAIRDMSTSEDGRSIIALTCAMMKANPRYQTLPKVVRK